MWMGEQSDKTEYIQHRPLAPAGINAAWEAEAGGSLEFGNRRVYIASSRAPKGYIVMAM